MSVGGGGGKHGVLPDEASADDQPEWNPDEEDLNREN
jgi:hypothetical protein